MLTRLLHTFRGRAPRSDDAVRELPERREPADPWRAAPTVAPDAPLPHGGELVDAWRQEVARRSIAICAQHPVAHAQRDQAARLLVKLTVDLDMVVRQPPGAAREALAAAADPRCELAVLVRVVERDPALVRGLMRHASSALHAAHGPPASIGDAVRRLGARGVQVAVLAGMAEALLARGSGPYGAMAQRVWEHMVRTGPVARALAHAFDVPADEAFLLGLLHDVGKLVLLDLIAATGDELRRDVVLPAAMLAEVLRELHEPLGGIVLLRWGVDARVAWAVAHHHRRAPRPERRDRRGELVFVAERVELAAARGQAIDADADATAWAAEGGLTTAPARVADAVARATAAVAQAA